MSCLKMKTTERVVLVTVILGCCILSCGCRRVLSSDGPSNLWPRYIQRQSDLAWTASGNCASPTHAAKLTSDYQAGFSKGYYDAAYSRILPAGPDCYQPPPLPKKVTKTLQNSPSPAVGQGYAHGSQVAAASTIAGFPPHSGPLPSVSRVYVKR